VRVQTEDLARMYRLFNRIPKGLEPIADMFKEHVEGEGMKRVREATEAAEAKKEKDAGGGPPSRCPLAAPVLRWLPACVPDRPARSLGAGPPEQRHA
jgi:hypothetical protein